MEKIISSRRSHWIEMLISGKYKILIKVRWPMNKRFLVLTLFLAFFSMVFLSTSVFATSFNVTVTPSVLNASTANQLINFTIGNEEPGDIYLVNISWPTGFAYIDNSNGTTVADNLWAGNFSSTIQNVTWGNATETGLISGGANASFWFNVSIPSIVDPTSYNFTVSIWNSTDDWNSTNATVTVYPNGPISPSPADGEYGSRTATFNCSAYDADQLGWINVSIYFTNGTLYDVTSTNVTGDGTVWNFTAITHTFPRDILRQANKTFTWNCTFNDTGADIDETPSRNLVIAVSDLYGYVKNSTGSLVESVNVSVYRYILQQSGPPVEQYVTSNLTNASGTSGFFTIYDANVSSVSGQQLLFKVYFTLNNSAGNATHTGPTLPPFPRQMVFKEIPGQQVPPGMPGINGSTIYLQNASTIRLAAINSTDDRINFGYEVIDQALGFAIRSCVQCNVASADIVVPRDRNYTVMVLRDPQTFTLSDDCYTGLMNQTDCPSPPISNGTIYNSLLDAAEEYVLNVTVNMSYSNYYLTGYINVSDGQNSSFVNASKFVLKLVPWPGFVPPMSAEIETFNISKHFNFTKGAEEGFITFYNISVMGSDAGIEYFIEFYGNGTDEYFAAFRNYTITGHMESNITLTRLAGTYIEGGSVNTSKITVEVHNSTGQNITTDAHVQMEITHSSFYAGQAMHYIVDSLTNGTFSMPLLNDSTVKVMVFSQDSAPRKVKVNLSSNVTNVTLKSFGMDFWNATTGEFQEFDVTRKGLLDLKFYRYSSECNVINPPAACQIGSSQTGDFDPLSAMMAGKSNLRLNSTSTNIILYFINVDLLASGPPDAQLSEAALSTSSSSSSFEQAWKFGSLAPDIYDHVWVGIPYSGRNESWSYAVTIPYLYDEDGVMIWDTSVNGTNPGAVYPEYSDYPAAWFTGVTCSKTDSTANCYMNTTSNYFWLKIPHFSSFQSKISGTGPAAVTAAAATTTGSVGIVTKTTGKITKTFTSIIPQSAGKVTEANLADSGTP